MRSVSVQIAGAGFDPRWLTDAGFQLSEGSPDAAVFAPSTAPRARVTVAFLPVVRSDGYHAMDGARDHSAVRADAYASERRGLVEGLRFALAEDRAARSTGPLRLTWLGSLGELPPVQPPIGTGFPLASSLRIGRLDTCEIVLRQGAHSDQCSVARLHAKVERTNQGARVTDLGSTNGFDVGGRRVREATLAPGDEVAICGTMRLRLDGAP